jgi:hypothetical protein
MWKLPSSLQVLSCAVQLFGQERDDLKNYLVPCLPEETSNAFFSYLDLFLLVAPQSFFLVLATKEGFHVIPSNQTGEHADDFGVDA